VDQLASRNSIDPHLWPPRRKFHPDEADFSD
jgi:hypothetical protein